MLSQSSTTKSQWKPVHMKKILTYEATAQICRIPKPSMAGLRWLKRHSFLLDVQLTLPQKIFQSENLISLKSLEKRVKNKKNIVLQNKTIQIQKTISRFENIRSLANKTRMSNASKASLLWYLYFVLETMWICW